MTIGKCPECGANGKSRERRPNGNDMCENGHVYPSAKAIIGTHFKYEIDRRYPFEATADSVCPVPDGAVLCVWFSGCPPHQASSDEFRWFIRSAATITHFMVLEYPPEKHTSWMNVDNDMMGFTVYDTREDADAYADRFDRLACIKIEWTKGEGL